MGMMLATSAGNDIMFDESVCEQGRNFGNKIWNAWRLVEGWTVADIPQPETGRLAGEWFEAALSSALADVEADFADYRISDALMRAYKLFWDDFSGWYLEMIKPSFGQPIDAATLSQVKEFFAKLLQMLHPFIPFVTEELWHCVAERSEDDCIIVSRMPVAGEQRPDGLVRFDQMREVVTAIRSIRTQKKILNRDALELKVVTDENYPAEFAPLLQKMANLSSIESVSGKDPDWEAFIVKTTQYFVPMEDKIDREAELAKLREDLVYQEGFLRTVMGKLNNERFVGSAPAQVVANEQTKRADAEAKIAALRERINALRG
jgi:valyl-tRNA synthetase